jgi:dTDP-4-amino-4,6-dideoxygalactose transaminase
MVKRFEEELAHYIGVKRAVATSSGTSALHLALLALDIKEGDEVLIPSYVCSALLNAILYVGAQPVLVDCHENYNISPEDFRRRLTNRTKACIIPHLFGHPAPIDELRAKGIRIIEDIAQSIGGEYKGRKLGSWGDIAVVSFYATKMITTGEGGAVLSNDADFMERIRELREYDEFGEYKVRFNYKMSDIAASIGIVQLEKLPSFIERRREIASFYSEELKDLNISLPPEDEPHSHSVYYRFVIRVKKLEEVRRKMLAKGIECKRPVYKPIHRYFSLPDYPMTDFIYETALSIPIYPSLSDSQVEYIASSLREAIGSL